MSNLRQRYLKDPDETLEETIKSLKETLNETLKSLLETRIRCKTAEDERDKIIIRCKTVEDERDKMTIRCKTAEDERDKMTIRYKTADDREVNSEGENRERPKLRLRRKPESSDSESNTDTSHDTFPDTSPDTSDSESDNYVSVAKKYNKTTNYSSVNQSAYVDKLSLYFLKQGTLGSKYINPKQLYEIQMKILGPKKFENDWYNEIFKQALILASSHQFRITPIGNKYMIYQCTTRLIISLWVLMQKKSKIHAYYLKKYMEDIVKDYYNIKPEHIKPITLGPYKEECDFIFKLCQFILAEDRIDILTSSDSEFFDLIYMIRS